MYKIKSPLTQKQWLESNYLSEQAVKLLEDGVSPKNIWHYATPISRSSMLEGLDVHTQRQIFNEMLRQTSEALALGWRTLVDALEQKLADKACYALFMLMYEVRKHEINPMIIPPNTDPQDDGSYNIVPSWLQIYRAGLLDKMDCPFELAEDTNADLA